MNKSNIGKSRQKTPRISSHRISIHPHRYTRFSAPEECSQRFSRLATTSSSDALNTKAGSKEISLDRRFGGSVPEAPPIHHFDLALSVVGCILSLIPPFFFRVYMVNQYVNIHVSRGFVMGSCASKCGSTVLAKICLEFESHIFLLMCQIPAGIAPYSQPIGSTYGGFTLV